MRHIRLWWHDSFLSALLDRAVGVVAGPPNLLSLQNNPILPPFGGLTQPIPYQAPDFQQQVGSFLQQQTYSLARALPCGCCLFLAARAATPQQVALLLQIGFYFAATGNTSNVNDVFVVEFGSNGEPCSGRRIP